MYSLWKLISSICILKSKFTILMQVCAMERTTSAEDTTFRWTQRTEDADQQHLLSKAAWSSLMATKYSCWPNFSFLSKQSRWRRAWPVCCSLVLLLFLFVCPVLSIGFPISFTRYKLLDIRYSTQINFSRPLNIQTFYWTFFSEELRSYKSAPGDASEGSALVSTSQSPLPCK